jgi:hypothetical protein
MKKLSIFKRERLFRHHAEREDQFDSRAVCRFPSNVKLKHTQLKVQLADKR